ncbi:hypothetical protein TVAG_351530 [Trichomonas vaginalis G3]|uniref:Uncharacterized protein n=1 Tax=Trichomonas vaginalis (strain ATCC PRA-98 / G3) TaxID=412133 RepID=A2DZN7_TRIV3|nr:hypothetical protein TVAGG3_0261070 [Trichomonas vaginalis G3]EAY14105.1 hypothetical protein TVAG_351530 [Trichomonas vaginalis G3]KAI5525114.1 hypothetical protein TVAGG3_0261070 [Trichomonas vaginalis G3]|eukprot:XP_001326328.1 hypothetical protein [Trichomonas vaginalis G3]
MKSCSHCVRCQCGNIECRDISKEAPEILHIHRKTIELLHENALNFSSLQACGIIVHNQNFIEPVNRGPKVFGLRCSSCKQTFYIFTCRSKFAIGFPKSLPILPSDSTELPSGFGDELIPQIPLILKPFIFAIPTKVSLQHSLSWEDDEIEPVDIDDDFMFSSMNNGTIVGSYEERPMMDHESYLSYQENLTFPNHHY